MKIKHFLFVILALLTVLSFASCKGNGNGTETGGIDTVDPKDALNVSDFKIMRSEEASQTVIDAAGELRDKIKEVCGYEITYDTDWIKKGDTVPTDTKEIVVGATNRRDTADVRTNDFRIIRDGNRIYILGGSDESTVEAVKYFIANIVHDKGLLIADKTDYLSAGKYSVEKLYFGATEMKELRIYNAATGDLNKGKTDGFVNVFMTYTGYKAQVAESEAEANIILRDYSADKVKDGKWGTVTADGKIELFCGETLTDTLALKHHLATVMEKSGGELKLENGSYAGKTLTKDEYNQLEQLVIYPEFPEKINRDYLYSVSVTQGETTSTLPVYNHTLLSTTSRGNDGGDNFRRFSTFAFSGKQVRVDIKVNKSFDSYSVMPSIKNFKHEYKDGVISVYLDKPEYFLIRLDNSDNSILSVFADYPEYPYEIDLDDENTTIIDGWVTGDETTGDTKIKKKGSTVYVKPGSVLYSKVNVMADNVTIAGRGAVVDPFGNLYDYNVANAPDATLIFTRGYNNMKVQGLHLLNSRTYSVECIGVNKDQRAEGTRVYDTKILSSEISSDGITFCYETGDSVAEHCFVYCGDNALVFEEDCTYRDIIVGTTCAALYPQTDVINAKFEDIHVFRADDGIIDNIWNGSGATGGFATGKDHVNIKNLVVDGLDAVDCTYVPRFFRGRNQGENPKEITLKNISLGSFKDLDTTHVVFLSNGSGDLFTDNYTIKMENIAIDGKLVANYEELSKNSQVYQQNTKKNVITYKVNGNFKGAVHDSSEVNYEHENEVVIGKYTVIFKDPVIVEGETVYLPYEQIKEELRTDATAETVTKNGIAYVSVDALAPAGMANLVEKDGHQFKITPKSKGQNLLLADRGEISFVTEKVAYNSHMTVEMEGDTPVYKVKNTAKTLPTGIFRFITEEIQKFGEGTYRITAKLKASYEGELNFGLNYKGYPEKIKSFDVDREWVEVSIDVDIKKIHLSQKYIGIVVHGEGEALPEFSMKDLALTKIA